MVSYYYIIYRLLNVYNITLPLAILAFPFYFPSGLFISDCILIYILYSNLYYIQEFYAYWVSH